MEIVRGRQHKDGPIGEPLEGTLLWIVELPAGQTPAERVKAILGDVPDWVEVEHGRAHRCDDRCACPANGKPMYYTPSTGQHACQDLNCEYAHPPHDETPPRRWMRGRERVSHPSRTLGSHP